MVLANTLLGGSGMLGIPHAFSVAGWGLGLVLLVLFCVLSAFGSHLIACTARKLGTAPCSFYSVSHICIPNWTWLVDGAVAIKCFGVGTSYLIIVGDLLPAGVQYFGGPNTDWRWLYVMIGWSVGAFLGCFKNLSALRYTATFAIVICAWTALMIVLFFFQIGEVFDPCSSWHGDFPCNGGTIMPVGHDLVAILKVLPVFIFGFTCQQNVFTVCNEVAVASNKRMNGIIGFAYTSSAIFFAITALMGYFTYGSTIASDVLKSYPDNAVVSFTRIVFAILATLSYPMQVHPSRNSWLALWRLVAPAGVGETPAEWDEQQASTENRRFWIVTFLYVACSLGVALVLSDLGKILGIVGATGSTTVTFILPGLVYFHTFREWHAKRYLALIQLCLGVVIMPTCLIVLFL